MHRVDEIRAFFRAMGGLSKWSNTAIHEGIIQAAQYGGLFYTVEHGQVVAAAIAEDRGHRQLHVMGIAARSLRYLRPLIVRFSINYPDYTITAHRRGKFVKYNTTRLCKKIFNSK